MTEWSTVQSFGIQIIKNSQPLIVKLTTLKQEITCNYPESSHVKPNPPDQRNSSSQINKLGN